ncbi:type IV pilus modification PilV family protein [Desulfohalobium retbaense]|uniref:Uncharacterized protein n=1 Tax=Desulfohalobium retbaense (strain ATCC 49708 / DSM 5692 / JCM 16813 / HR100) TaxID=485915 RepID=C8X4R1_DESRD|nr:type II secretion system protein [Desulfohalobium retbaense]ACV69284.1 hypothetical protein Dret_2000 [Desulfohalobium retbaense DSM 5692]
MRTWKYQKGVTLLELVIGLVLFGIIAWGFTAAILPSLKNMTQRSEAPEEWLHAARSEMEEIIHECDQGVNGSICNKNAEVTNATICDNDHISDGYCEIIRSGSPNDDYGDIILRLPLQ